MSCNFKESLFLPKMGQSQWGIKVLSHGNLKDTSVTRVMPNDDGWVSLVWIYTQQQGSRIKAEKAVQHWPQFFGDDVHHAHDDQQIHGKTGPPTTPLYCQWIENNPKIFGRVIEFKSTFQSSNWTSYCQLDHHLKQGKAFWHFLILFAYFLYLSVGSMI